MARIFGLEKEQAPWHLCWFYGVMRKMFGKDLMPAKVQMRLPGLVWGGVPWKPLSAANDLFHCATFNWEKCAPRRASIAHSE